MAIPSLDVEKGYELYRTMALVRRFEQRAYELYVQGKILGGIHSCIGQEAVAAGVIVHLRRDDMILATHRAHGQALAKGARADRMLAELLGRRTGYCKGKGGSMHVADFSVGMLGAVGIVGSSPPLAVGLALSAQVRGTDQVTVAFFGDGAAQEGGFHEALNLASLWKLPVAFVCENNLYAASTRLAKESSVSDIALRAQGYNMPGIIVDGMDVGAVYNAAGEAIARVRAGEGPVLLEMKTYRFMGHSRGDSGVGKYRTREEVEAWQRRDPLSLAVDTLHLDMGRIRAIDQAVHEEIEAAVTFAENSPYPAPEEAFEDVFATGR